MRLKAIHNGFFLLLVAAATYAFYWVIRDLVAPLFWAGVFAVIFQPVYQLWKRTLRGRSSASALLTMITIVLVVIVPLALVGMALSQEVMSLYGRIESGEVNPQRMVDAVEQWLPSLGRFAGRFGIDLNDLRERVGSGAVAASEFLAAGVLAFGQNAIRFTALLFIMLYLLFFFLRDGARLTDLIIRAIPLGDNRARRLFGKVAEVSRATIKGTIVVGVVQGGIGGLMFWILGIGAPIFWGMVMTLLSLVPAVGTALIWGPAALILILSGEVVKGVVLIGAGVLIIGLADNMLRPLLVGRDTKMPDYLVLISTLGGLTVFGITGFVVGPIVAAVFLAVWDMFQEEYPRRADPQAVKLAAEHPETIPPPKSSAITTGPPPPETP